MDAFLAILLAVLPVFCVGGAGALMRKVNWLTEEADNSLMLLTINLLIPAFIFSNLQDNEALRDFHNLLLPPLMGFLTVAAGIGVGWLLCRWSGLTQRKELKTFAYSVGIFNYGYIPIPLTLLLFDKETLGVLIVFNVGVELALWTFGKAMLASGSMSGLWRKIVSPPLITIVVTLTLNFTGGFAHVPEFLLETARMLGHCAIPMGLILIGAVMADNLGRTQKAWSWRIMAAACSIRLLILPLLFLLLAVFLPASLELKRVILLQAAMPAAVVPILISRLYDGDPLTALRVVVATTLTSAATIPLWLHLGHRILEG